jgi:putative FmdB family regulatory protein
MPIYEYKCANGHVFDVMQRMSDEPLSECRECGAPVKRVLHPVGISFKGSGFYSTDYTKQGPKAEPASANGEPAAKSGSPNGDGSGKPEKTEKPTKKD